MLLTFIQCIHLPNSKPIFIFISSASTARRKSSNSLFLYLPSARQEVRAVILFCVKWHLLLTCDKISCQAYLKLFTYLIIW
jgi:hypothetical protein